MKRRPPSPGKVLKETLYCYVEKENRDFAVTYGCDLFGSHSAYVNALIAKDRGAKAKLGHWRAEFDRKKLTKKKKRKSMKYAKREIVPSESGSTVSKDS